MQDSATGQDTIDGCALGQQGLNPWQVVIEDGLPQLPMWLTILPGADQEPGRYQAKGNGGYSQKRPVLRHCRPSASGTLGQVGFRCWHAHIGLTKGVAQA